MHAPTRSARGFTRTELLVVIAMIVILMALAVPYVSGMLLRGALVSCVSNTRFIHGATMSMAADGVSSKNPALGWPGDLKANGRITTVADFVNVLVRNDYFKPDDLVFFSNTGFKSFFPNTGYKPYRGVLSSGSNGVLVPAFTEENCAFKVYLVKDADSSNTVFLASKNYIYNTPLNNPNAKPFGVNGFVVCRKGGDVSILKKEQAQSLQVNQPGSSYYVGQLPGGGTVENAANCLNPGQ